MRTNNSNNSSIWIIEDHDAYSRQLKRGLKMKFPRAQIHIFQSWNASLNQLRRTPPDIALVDIGLPGMDGIEGLTHLKNYSPNALALILTVFHDEDKILRALAAGANGYLLKDTPFDNIIAAVKKLSSGDTPLSPSVTKSMIEMLARNVPQATEVKLTLRELSVIRLLSEGFQKKEIANRLNLNRHTTDYLIRTLYRKLNAHCSTTAVRTAIQLGIIEA